MTDESGELPSRSIRTKLLGVLAVAAIIALDQLTKNAVINGQIEQQHVVGPIEVALTYNRGVAFGLGGSFAPILVAIGLTVLLVSLRRLANSWRTIAGLVLVLGGGVSNIVDRTVRDSKAVVDWISVGWWPTFNLADSFITCGIILVLWTQRKTLFAK